MQFTKMHGAGNDYIFVDCFQVSEPDDPSAVAVAVSDRHTGIGSDGLILICPSTVADAEMKMWNADGSPAEMCGNGLRCVAKYLYEHGIVPKRNMRIATGSGTKQVELELHGGSVERVRLDMGAPIFEPEAIPTLLVGSPPVDASIAISRTLPLVDYARQELRVTALSMGNPHCVTFVDELSDDWVLGVGPLLEVSSEFPNGVNAEFVQVVNEAEIRMRVWERGSGETLACGTGACAAVVACVLTHRTGRDVTVHLPGGTLQVEWATTGEVFLTGPAVEVFRGEWLADSAAIVEPRGKRRIA